MATYEQESRSGEVWLNLQKSEVPALVAEYVNEITTTETNKYCTCEWIIHPEDIEVPQNKQRMRRGEESPDCWIHTKEGFLLGFFTWVFQERQAQSEPTCPACHTVHDPPYKFGCNAQEKATTDEPTMVMVGNADQMLQMANYLAALNKDPFATVQMTGVRNEPGIKIVGHWPDAEALEEPHHIKGCIARTYLDSKCGKKNCNCWCHNSFSPEVLDMEHDAEGNYIGPIDGA